jgi:UDP-glucose 4-epimerase
MPKGSGLAVVTGGLGCVGSAVVRQLAAADVPVRVIDASLPGGGAHDMNLRSVSNNVEVYRVDVRDTDQMADLVAGAVRIFHCAARTGHVASMRDPFADLDVNAKGGLSLFEACRRSSPSSVIVVAGTRQVYGRPRRLPVPESHRIAPPDVNAVHMHAVEQYCALYRSVYGLRPIVARLTNVYGPGMRIADARQMFLGIWIRRVLENG